MVIVATQTNDTVNTNSNIKLKIKTQCNVFFYRKINKNNKKKGYQNYSAATVTYLYDLHKTNSLSLQSPFACKAFFFLYFFFILPSFF
ncbi:hypothetical protein GDO78_010921 [Eleutherodactylus coqui]|uniref:Uncharacterized protein n=1 Tax=Eleutherodactylus coqui TaxID=57060 RepID=A0A8J6K7Y2_ELECQ|nr:hypothetical protein GDO78_010921 [Eleutherodactylus coqui]